MNDTARKVLERELADIDRRLQNLVADEAKAVAGLAQLRALRARLEAQKDDLELARS